MRKKILYEQSVFTSRAFSEPETVRQELLAGVRGHLGPDYDIGKDFTPSYLPWRQRIAFIPDGDMLQSIRAGKASVATDQIECFEDAGIRLKSGRLLEADIIVTATGFNLSVLGDIAFTIDGAPLVFSETVTYRGMMFTGVPNLAWVFGYFRASWTLRADLVADFVCRLLQHMDRNGAQRVTPALRSEDRDMKLMPWIDPANFQSGLFDARAVAAAEVRRQAGMAAHPRLLDRKGYPARHRPRRPRVRLCRRPPIDKVGVRAWPQGSANALMKSTNARSGAGMRRRPG